MRCERNPYATWLDALLLFMESQCDLNFALHGA